MKFRNIALLAVFVTTFILTSFYFMNSADDGETKIMTSESAGGVEIADTGEPTEAALKDKPELGVDKQKVFVATKNYGEDWCSVTELNEDSQNKATQIFSDWNESHGYFSSDKLNHEIYSSYPVDVLKSLGEQGDQRALTAIYHHPDIDDTEKEKAAHMSLLHGGTRLAVYMGTELSARAYGLYRTGNLEDAKKTLLEAFAWNEFAAMRGDLVGISQSIWDVERKRQLGKMDIPLQEDDLAAIANKAKAHYEEVVRKRALLGLEKFDETLPKIATQMNEWKVSTILNKGYSGDYARKYLVETNCVKRNIAAFENLASR